jgi:hypothetical protein
MEGDGIIGDEVRLTNGRRRGRLGKGEWLVMKVGCGPLSSLRGSSQVAGIVDYLCIG